MNPDPDYSAAYVILETDRPGLEGHGLTFTIGRGNQICCAAIEAMRHLVVGLELDWIAEDMGAFWRRITGDHQLRWVGPEKGVIHLATAAIVNAVWDLWAKVAGKPLWKLLADMRPEELVRCVDFRYITDALTPDEALAMLTAKQASRARARSRDAARTAIRRTPRRAGGWATATRRSAACAAKRWRTAGGTSSSRSARTWKTTSGAAASCARKSAAPTS